jgi:hypothetical protein
MQPCSLGRPPPYPSRSLFAPESSPGDDPPPVVLYDVTSDTCTRSGSVASGNCAVWLGASNVVCRRSICREQWS